MACQSLLGKQSRLNGGELGGQSSYCYKDPIVSRDARIGKMRRTVDSVSPQNIQFAGMSHIRKLYLIPPRVASCMISMAAISHACFIEVCLVMIQNFRACTTRFLPSKFLPSKSSPATLQFPVSLTRTATRIGPLDIGSGNKKHAGWLRIATLSGSMQLWTQEKRKHVESSSKDDKADRL